MVAEKLSTPARRSIWDASSGTYIADGEPTGFGGGGSAPTRKPTTVQPPSYRFLRGPVPWDWMIRAASLQRSALIVGLCLWRLKGSKKSETVMLANSELKPFGIGRAAKSRALAALEKAGLITVQHHRGRFPTVTLLAPPTGDN